MAFDPMIGKRTQFKPGQSGNPSGRPGYRARAEKLLEKQASNAQIRRVLKVILEKAEDGESWACKMLMDRILPPVQQLEVERVEAVPVGELESALDRLADHMDDPDGRVLDS